MGGRNSFSFGLQGIEAMITLLDKFEGDMEAGLVKGLENLGDSVVHDAKRLSPLGTINPHDPSYHPGALEATIIRTEVKRDGDTFYVEVGTSPEVDDYAVVQHEGFRRTKSGRVVWMNPGETTRSKGAYMGFQPGKKFLQNAVVINVQKINKIMLKGFGKG